MAKKANPDKKYPWRTRVVIALHDDDADRFNAAAAAAGAKSSAAFARTLLEAWGNPGKKQKSKKAARKKKAEAPAE